MELLAPAGNLEKVKYAVVYGADAVYAGSKDYSLRAKADNFDSDDLIQAVDFCHQYKAKLFVPLNIYAHNRHIEDIKTYVKNLQYANIDAIIVSDIGVLDIIKNIAPDIPIHISTQANVTSYHSVKAFQSLGAKRIILARELTFDEIKEIRQKCPDMELEMFVHGAMCISYSGRCLLSAFLNNRSANRGECTQPCRWKYNLVEESRPKESFPIQEDKHGFYFMNSKDLCLYNRLDEIYQAGIDSVKIEGRMKSLYYIAAVTRAYKAKINNCKSKENLQDTSYKLQDTPPYPLHKCGGENSPHIYGGGRGGQIELQTPNSKLQDELDKISHRIYTEAFFDGFNVDDTQNYDTSTYIRDWQFVGNILNSDNGYAFVQSYSKIDNNDQIEIIFPDAKYDLALNNPILFDENFKEISFTKPNSRFYIKLDKQIPQYGIIRVKNHEF